MSRKTENVDIGFASIKEAANEYTDFILGIPDGDVISAILGKKSTETPEDILENRAIRNVLSEISDRTNGGCSISDIQYVADDKWKAVVGKSPESIVTVFHTRAKAGPSVAYTFNGYDPQNSYDIADTYDDYLVSEMRHVVKYIDPKKFANRTVIQPPTGREPLDLDQVREVLSQRLEGAELEAAIARAQATGEGPRTVSIEELQNSDIVLDQVPPETFNVGEGNNFSKNEPSLGAVVIKDPRHGFNARSANHMPVFLSAISPLEMSRCSPYLDVKVFTRQKSNYNKMGIYNFIRATEDEKNKETTFYNPVPASAEPLLSEAGEGRMINYMDLFTSPQTMVNANINREWFGEELSDIKDSFSQFKKDEGLRSSSEYNFSKVTDPLQPFMSLLSFNVSITGVGHGLLATKKASMKIKLHDKSRINDISPLLSPKEFGSTKFIVEFGWTHPDASLTSTNTLGKYLNALRDTGTYQLVNADYNFGEDNSVDITLNLVCSGFNQLTSVSAAGGKLISFDSIIDDLEEIIDDYIETRLGNDLPEDKKSRARRVKEIRGRLRLGRGDLSKVGSLIPFERLQNWRQFLYTNVFTKEVADDEGNITEEQVNDFLGNLYSLVYGIDYNLTENSIKELSEDPSLRDDLFSVLDSSSVNAGDVIVAKLKSLPYGIDPFRAQCSSNHWEYLSDLSTYGEDTTAVWQHAKLIGSVEEGKTYLEAGTDYVSLGKIISCFIGYPLSTCGLYDEVQLFFYPVNSQAAAARKHTTASLPIKVADLEEQIKKRILASEDAFRDLSTRGFFSMLERIVSNVSIPAYGIYMPNDGSFYNQLQEFREAERAKKLEILKGNDTFQRSADIIEVGQQAEAALAQAAEEDIELTEKQKAEYEEDLQITAYESFLAKKLEDEKSDKIRKIYEFESLESAGITPVKQNYLDKSKFTPINLSMYFETFPTRDKPLSETGSQPTGFKELAADFFKLNRRDLDSKGIDYGKTCLRIHIYDENTVMNPDNSLFGTNFRNSKSGADDAMIENLNSYGFVKNLIMQNHPTIIHGAATGVVNSVRVSSNTSSPLSNILIVESYGQTLEDSDDGDPGDGFDETVLLPTTVNLEIMGFPMLARGQQIFIDFGTNTSLDNLYMVKTVDHIIEAGNFKTSAVLTATNQMIVTSFRNRLKDMMSLVSENS